MKPGLFSILVVLLSTWHSLTVAWLTPPVPTTMTRTARGPNRLTIHMHRSTPLSRDHQSEEVLAVSNAFQHTFHQHSVQNVEASFRRTLGGALVAGGISWSCATASLAEYIDPDDVGVTVSSNLPPAWIPVVVVAVLSIGIFLQQQSLGDVIDDEARLGKLSGARAAKQSARDRSMFKKNK